VFCIDDNDEEWAMRMNGLNSYLKFKAKCGEEMDDHGIYSLLAMRNSMLFEP
jgi:hypothetical protein